MTRFLLATALCGLAFAASAQTASVSAGVSAGDGAATDTPALSDRNCLRETGSRLVAARNTAAAQSGDNDRRRCVSAPGRSYSREDLERTGSVDIADALRRLDTSIR